MSSAHLDASPERRTDLECSPRSRPGDRFWSQTPIAKHGRYVIDPVHPFGSICNSISYIHLIAETLS